MQVFAKLIDNELEYPELQTLELLNGHWIRRDKTAAELIAEGNKLVILGTQDMVGDYFTVEYTEDDLNIYKHIRGHTYTEEQLLELQNKERARLDNLSMPRETFYTGLLIASSMRPDLTGGALITKEVLKTAITIKPLDDEFTEVARELSLIWVDEMCDMVRSHPFVDGTLKDIGFTSEAIDKFFETTDPTDLIVGWTPTIQV